MIQRRCSRRSKFLSASDRTERNLTPEHAIAAAWLIWLASWLIAAFWADRAAKRPGLRQEWLYRLVTGAGAVLLFGRLGRFHLHGLWSVGDAGWALVLVALAGFAFAWWARIHLGRLWSGSVTMKTDHRVVDTGPYALVRHPIYTGLLAAVIATALLKGTLLGLAGAVLIIVGTWIKAKLEEDFLRGQLGAEAYDAYRRNVPMLVPFAGRSRPQQG